MERSPIVFVVELETLVDRGLCMRSNERRCLVVKHECDGRVGGVDLIESQALLDEICLFGDADAGRVDRTVGNVAIIASTQNGSDMKRVTVLEKNRFCECPCGVQESGL